MSFERDGKLLNALLVGQDTVSGRRVNVDEDSTPSIQCSEWNDQMLWNRDFRLHIAQL